MRNALKININKWLLPLLMVIAFVVSQQHVLTHPISHIQDEQSQSQHNGKHSSQGGFCEECASLINLTGALPSVILPPAIIHPSSVFANTPFLWLTRLFSPHYSARAPPIFSR